MHGGDSPSKTYINRSRAKPIGGGLRSRVKPLVPRTRYQLRPLPGRSSHNPHNQEFDRFNYVNNNYSGSFRSRPRPKYLPRGRDRRRGCGRYVHLFGDDTDSVIHNVDPVVEKILQQLAYPTKKAYEPKDVVWIKEDSAEWVISIIKYSVPNDRFIVRPLNESSDGERVVRSNQIFPAPGALSLRNLQRSISSLKDELSNLYSTEKQEEIFQGTFIKYKNDLFGEVIAYDHEEHTYTIEMSNKCKWYIGPVVIKQVERNDIQISHPSELMYHILRRQKPNEPIAKVERKRNWHSDNENELQVYDFLEEMGDLHIDTFLFNGISNVKIALCLQEADLKEMEIKLGHRRYIMNLIKSYHLKEAQVGSEKYDQSEEEKEMNLGARNNKENAQKLIIYDFNRTLTCIDLYYEVQPETYGNVDDMLNEMSDERFLRIFGGNDRIRRLHEHFKLLTAGNVQLAIVSFAYTTVIKDALKRIGLFQNYFANSTIIGGDSMEMQLYNGNKATYILNTFISPEPKVNAAVKEWNATDILLVDDDPAVIEQVTDMKVCKSLLIDPRSGLTEQHMALIENMIHGKTDNTEHNLEECVMEMELEGVSYVKQKGDSNDFDHK